MPNETPVFLLVLLVYIIKKIHLFGLKSEGDVCGGK